MKNSNIARLIGLAGAACTTLVIFSQVASLADHDRAALYIAKAAPAQLAAVSGTTPR